MFIVAQRICTALKIFPEIIVRRNNPRALLHVTSRCTIITEPKRISLYRVESKILLNVPDRANVGKRDSIGVYCTVPSCVNDTRKGLAIV